MKVKIVSAAFNHVPFIKKIIDSVALFPSEYIDGMMNDFFTNTHTLDHWLCALIEEVPVAVAYFAPEKLTEGTYNLYLIAVDKEFHGNGLGTQLLKNVEEILKESGHRVLIVETSGLNEFEQTRNFYEKCAFHKEAKIRDFYKEGEDKIIFWKKLK